MTTKEQLIQILKHPTYQKINDEEAIPMGEEYEADQILDLILSKIVIERKEVDSERCGACDQDKDSLKVGFNECIDQLEEIKRKLRG